MKTPALSDDADGKGIRLGVVAATWNADVTDRLVRGATQKAEALGVDEVTVVRVPGALELPLAAKQMAQSGYDAVVAIGVVVKGDTDHYEIVVRESTRGLTLVALETGVPVLNAILAVHEFGDALDRAGEGSDNKGHEAATAAVEMVAAMRSLGDA